VAVGVGVGEVAVTVAVGVGEVVTAVVVGLDAVAVCVVVGVVGVEGAGLCCAINTAASAITRSTTTMPTTAPWRDLLTWPFEYNTGVFLNIDAVMSILL